MKCRHCNSTLKHTFVDLGTSPPSNAYVPEHSIKKPESWYPLKVKVCSQCWLVQTEDFVREETMFSDDYAYYSSFSTSWLEHAKKYTKDMLSRFHFNSSSMVVEVAANDGYLLQYMQKSGIPCYGIEPTHGTAEAARKKGIEIVEDFFGVLKAKELAAKGLQADLMIANNVLAHVPDINDFCNGFSILLKPNGIVTFEFPHLLNLVDEKQFDTIYHEHYSYLSLISAQKILNNNGLSIFDVEELSTHGGSLRVYAQRSDTGKRSKNKSVAELEKKEKTFGLNTINYYENFQEKVEKIKLDFLKFLVDAKQNKMKIVAYGAAAKGNTLINFSGIKPDLISYVVDKNPMKQGKYLPGSRIPIVGEKTLKLDKPDYIIVLPWNLKEDIFQLLRSVCKHNVKLVTIIPKIEIV